MHGLHLSLLYRYMRMPLESFKYLPNVVGLIISKENTRFRKAIPYAKRLCLTLHYLAHSSSQHLLVFPLGSQNLQSAPLSTTHAKPFGISWASSMYGHQEQAITGNALPKILKTFGIYCIALVRQMESTFHLSHHLTADGYFITRKTFLAWF